MKLKVVEGYFFDGPKIYRTGEIFEFDDKKAASLVNRSHGDIAYVTETPAPVPKAKNRKAAKKVKPVAEDEEDEEMSLPDADAEAAISR